MYRAFFLVVLAFGISGCNDRNLLGEQVWPDEQLAQAEVGFGWNYEIVGGDRRLGNVNVIIKPDNSFEIQISEYQNEAEPDILSQIDGSLAPKVATRLRRDLAQLRSSDGEEVFTTLPNCPMRLPPTIDYYVGFKTSKNSIVTVIERDCDTPETIAGRKIISDAMAVFPQIDRKRLVAGSRDL